MQDWKLAELPPKGLWSVVWSPGEARGIPQELVLDLGLLNIFNNDLGGEAEWTLTKSAEYTTLGGVAATPDGWVGV